MCIFCWFLSLLDSKPAQISDDGTVKYLHLEDNRLFCLFVPFTMLSVAILMWVYYKHSADSFKVMQYKAKWQTNRTE